CMSAATKRRAISIRRWNWQLTTRRTGSVSQLMPLTAFRECSGLGRMRKRSFVTARLHADAMLTSTESTALRLAVGSGLTTRSELGESYRWHEWRSALGTALLSRESQQL